jgi:hypothetical protein
MYHAMMTMEVEFSIYFETITTQGIVVVPLQKDLKII